MSRPEGSNPPVRLRARGLPDRAREDTMTNKGERSTIMKIDDEGDGNVRVFVDITSAINKNSCALNTENGLATAPGFWGVLLAIAARHCAKAHHGFLSVLHERGRIEKLPTEEKVMEGLTEVLCDELKMACRSEGEKILGAVVLRRLEAEFDEGEDEGEDEDEDEDVSYERYDA